VDITCGQSNCNGLERVENKIDKLLDLHSELRVTIAEIKKDVSVNTVDLTEHKEGVIQCRTRIDALEKPVDAVKTVAKIIAWLASIAGAVAGTLKYFGIF
jgi:chromosome segregation ATPase